MLFGSRAVHRDETSAAWRAVSTWLAPDLEISFSDASEASVKLTPLSKSDAAARDC